MTALKFISDNINNYKIKLRQTFNELNNVHVRKLTDKTTEFCKNLWFISAMIAGGSPIVV